MRDSPGASGRAQGALRPGCAPRRVPRRARTLAPVALVLLVLLPAQAAVHAQAAEPAQDAELVRDAEPVRDAELVRDAEPVRAVAQVQPPFDAPEALFRGYGLIEGGSPVGVPLGGLGTGRLDFCADGTFRNLTLGPTTAIVAWHDTAFLELDAQRAPPADPTAPSSPVTRRALVSGGAGGLPGVTQLAYRGLFPRAFLRASDEALGLRAEVEAFAPLVPHDLSASTWPAIGFRVVLRETSGKPTRATVTLHVPARADWTLPHAVVAEAAPGVEIVDCADGASAAVDLPAGGEREVFLALAWSVHDHPAAARFADASAAATAFLAQWRELHAGTRAWQALLFDSGLPRWYAERLVNDLSTLTTNTRVSAAGVLATAEGGVGMGGITGTLDQRRVSHVMTQAFFPQLDLTELEVFAARQDERGRVPHHVGTLADGALPAGEGFLDWPDLACSFTLQTLKTWLWTGDRQATRALLPHVKAALAWLRSMDTDGDGIPEGGSTFDYTHAPPGFSYTASMTLAAQAAGARLAADFGDEELARSCTADGERTRAALVTRLWNGRWFVASMDGAGTEGDAGSFLSQLAGEWTARAFGLGPILPEALVARAAESLVARHGGASPWIPPLGIDEDGGAARASFGWLPYALTDYVSLLIQLERADSAWTTLAGIDRMLVERSGDPFCTGLYYDPVTGARLGENYRWYMSAPASWWTLFATEGFALDLPRGTLNLSPSLPTWLPRAALPIFAPTFTAVCRTADAAFGVERTMELDVIAVHGEPPVLRRLVTRVPVTAADRPVDCTLELDGRPCAAAVTLSGRDLVAEFAEPVTLRPGSLLRVRLVEPEGRRVGAALEQAQLAHRVTFGDEHLSVELRLGARGLQRATLQDDRGHEARLDVADLFQFLLTSAGGVRQDLRTDPAWTRLLQVTEVSAAPPTEAGATGCLLRHVLALRGRGPDQATETLEVEVEITLVPGEPDTRWRLRARSAGLAAAASFVVRFPRLACVDPDTVGDPLVAELGTQPGALLADPVRTLSATSAWTDAPLWAQVHGPRGTLELRSGSAVATRSLSAEGDRVHAVALALLTGETPAASAPSPGKTSAGVSRADDDWRRGWDAVAEAWVSLR